MLTIHSFDFNPFAVKTYVVSNQSGECVVIDPGCYLPAEREQLSDYLRSNNLLPKQIWITHTHLDHIFGVKYLKDKYSIPIYAHLEAPSQIKLHPLVSQMYGIPFEPCPMPDLLLSHADTVTIGDDSFQVMYCPGHSTDSVVFYHAQQEMLFSGDVIFAGGIGRTDLPGGDYDTLMASIRNQILPLPPQTKLYPGHGFDSTIEQEKLSNPFII